MYIYWVLLPQNRDRSRGGARVFGYNIGGGGKMAKCFADISNLTSKYVDLTSKYVDVVVSLSCCVEKLYKTQYSDQKKRHFYKIILHNEAIPLNDFKLIIYSDII